MLHPPVLRAVHQKHFVSNVAPRCSRLKGAFVDRSQDPQAAWLVIAMVRKNHLAGNFPRWLGFGRQS